MKELICLSVKTKADLIRVRQHIRRISRMLGFDSLQQAKISCIAFEMVCGTFLEKEEAILQAFYADGKISIRTGTLPRISPCQFPEEDEQLTEIPVPNVQDDLSEEDVVWAIRAMNRYGKTNLFEEIRQQNNDLLRALLELQQLQRLNQAANNRRANAA